MGDVLASDGRSVKAGKRSFIRLSEPFCWPLRTRKCCLTFPMVSIFSWYKSVQSLDNTMPSSSKLEWSRARISSWLQPLSVSTGRLLLPASCFLDPEYKDIYSGLDISLHGKIGHPMKFNQYWKLWLYGSWPWSDLQLASYEGFCKL